MAELYVWTRVHTGRCFARAHLRERGSNVIVWSCPHEHWARRPTPKNGWKYTSGDSLARKCAERELRRRMKQHFSKGGGQ